MKEIKEKKKNLEDKLAEEVRRKKMLKDDYESVDSSINDRM